jgi:hypothetical protein
MAQATSTAMAILVQSLNERRLPYNRSVRMAQRSYERRSENLDGFIQKWSNMRTVEIDNKRHAVQDLS